MIYSLLYFESSPYHENLQELLEEMLLKFNYEVNHVMCVEGNATTTEITVNLMIRSLFVGL
jgi:hypothetical protein